MEKFSKLRIKQLFDDCRIFSAFFASIGRGKHITDQKTGQKLSALDVIKRYARARALLLALGYPLGVSKKGKTTPEFKKMFKLALPSIKYYYSQYRGKVFKS